MGVKGDRGTLLDKLDLGSLSEEEISEQTPELNDD